MSVDEADTLEPGIEEGLSADSTLTGLGQHVADVGVVPDSAPQVRPPGGGGGIGMLFVDLS